jgi:hypothetical protein
LFAVIRSFDVSWTKSLELLEFVMTTEHDKLLSGISQGDGAVDMPSGGGDDDSLS